MHRNPPIYHRDIRWPNIIKRAGNMQLSKWFLIDWDDASAPPTTATPHLNYINHSPDTFKDNHGGEVDIWSVGQLICEAERFITGLSANLLKAGQWMKEYRPTPDDILDRFRELRLLEGVIDNYEDNYRGMLYIIQRKVTIYI